MSLKEKIQDDIKSAMRAQNKDLLSTLRLLGAAIKQREVDERITLDDSAIVAIIEKMIKQRHESIRQYEAGHRPELAAKEQAEITILQAYLPERLSEEVVRAIIQEAIQTTGASSPKDMGKVMGVIKEKLQGRADMGQASALVKSLLNA